MLALLTWNHGRENVTDFSYVYKTYRLGLLFLIFFFPVSIWGPLEAAAQCSASAAGDQTSEEESK